MDIMIILQIVMDSIESKLSRACLFVKPHMIRICYSVTDGSLIFPLTY